MTAVQTEITLEERMTAAEELATERHAEIMAALNLMPDVVVRTAWDKRHGMVQLLAYMTAHPDATVDELMGVNCVTSWEGKRVPNRV